MKASYVIHQWKCMQYCKTIISDSHHNKIKKYIGKYKLQACIYTLQCFKNYPLHILVEIYINSNVTVLELLEKKLEC